MFSNYFLVVFSYFLNSLIILEFSFLYDILAIRITIYSNTIHLGNNLNYFCFEIPPLSETKPPDVHLQWGFPCCFMDSFIFSYTSTALF